jgi:hypothetical protein
MTNFIPEIFRQPIKFVPVKIFEFFNFFYTAVYKNQIIPKLLHDKIYNNYFVMKVV